MMFHPIIIVVISKISVIRTLMYFLSSHHSFIFIDSNASAMIAAAAISPIDVIIIRFMVVSILTLSERGYYSPLYFFLIGLSSAHASPLKTSHDTITSPAMAMTSLSNPSIYDSVFLSKAFVTCFSPL